MVGFRELIVGALKEATGEDVEPSELKDSPRGDLGCPIGFKLAKKLGRSPEHIAKDVASKIVVGGLISSAEADGGYVNVTLDGVTLAKMLNSQGEKPSKKGVKVVLEHTSVNPTGPVHVGRIRNTIIGDCLRRLLLYGGYDVETHYYVNDVGKQVAIIAAGLEAGVKPDSSLVEKYREYVDREDYQIFFTYVVSNRLYEADPVFQTKVQSMIHAAESGDDASLAKITSAARRCLEGQLKTFARFGVVFDSFDYESDGLRDGSVRKVLDKIRESPDYTRNESGEGLDLSRFGLGKRGGMTVLARPDGTSVYTTRDLAYHLKKIGLGDRIINVLGEDHKLQFQELRTILAETFGVGKKLEVVHFSFVSFEGMKFSTRRGDIAAADELMDEAVSKAEAEAERRQLGDEKTASMIGVGAVRFHIIKTTPTKQICFRWEDALNFEGESGPYIQYAHARSCRILEKSGMDVGRLSPIGYDAIDEEEKKLMILLLQFSEVAEDAAKQLRPDIVAAYLLDLTAAYGRFYMKCQVLDSEEGVRNRRLMIVGKLRDTVKCGLDILGIEAPERM